eukprot:1551191-Lingulodinium_polyedra.AAC.1
MQCNAFAREWRLAAMQCNATQCHANSFEFCGTPMGTPIDLMLLGPTLPGRALHNLAGVQTTKTIRGARRNWRA